MISKMKRLFILGLIMIFICRCEKDNNNDSNISFLLTNDSSKTWCLSKIITNDKMTITLPSCLVDDENEFFSNGKLLIRNMGTTYNNSTSPIFSGLPDFCFDTISIVDTAIWTLNKKSDILKISTSKYVISGQIIKLINDSLIIKRTYNDSICQIEYYVNKRD